MEEGAVPLSTTLENPPNIMDFDYMDELLLEGCWIEAARPGPEFPHFDSSTPISPFEPSFMWPALEPDESGSGPSKAHQDEMQMSSFHAENISTHMDSSAQSENQLIEPSKRWWIGPRASRPVMDRLIQALGYIKNSSGDKDVLIQVWVPVTREGKRVLTTNDQPFSLDLSCPKLARYREISVKYHFPADEDSKEIVGLPGRVFRKKVPEWTPDVRFFSWEEYPRVGHAQRYDVRGSLAVPILEQGSRSCLGVIEVVLTRQMIRYLPELEGVCKALEAVDLRSAEGSNTKKVKTSDLSYRAALPEILDVLRSASETHKLPLAQTWVPCVLQGKGGCWHPDENSKDCIAPVYSACYIGDPSIHGFHEACSEHHLLKGQGIVGRAFQTNQPCFSTDVSSYCKTEYPLSHHARMFGLKAAVAIRLRSTHTGSADFVLEFFLPTNCNDPEEQKQMLTSLSEIIQIVCQSLRVVRDEELREESRSGIRLGQRDSDTKEGTTVVPEASGSCDGRSLYGNGTGEKRRIKAEKSITLQVLRQHFAGSIKDAARNLGVCPTTLKRICRQHGIQRWPSRSIKKVGHSLQKIQRVIDSVQVASGLLQIESFYPKFPELASPNASRTTQHSNSKSGHSPKPIDTQPETTILKPTGPPSASPLSSCSQSSTSSQCCSSGAHPNPKEEREPVNGMMKRARSDVNLHLSSNGPKPLPRAHSHVSLYLPDKQETVPPPTGQKAQERDGPRIKVTYGEDTIRFRMQNNWRYRDLLQEISRRFGVENAGGYHLKYLDDDAEWVLLTCDADLEECIDVCRPSRSQTIRLSFLRDSPSQFGRFICVRGPLSL